MVPPNCPNLTAQLPATMRLHPSQKCFGFPHVLTIICHNSKAIHDPANSRNFYPDDFGQFRLSCQNILYFPSIFALMGGSSIKTSKFYIEMMALCASFVIGTLVFFYSISSAFFWDWFPEYVSQHL